MDQLVTTIGVKGMVPAACVRCHRVVWINEPGRLRQILGRPERTLFDLVGSGPLVICIRHRCPPTWPSRKEFYDAVYARPKVDGDGGVDIGPGIENKDFQGQSAPGQGGPEQPGRMPPIEGGS